MLNCLFLHGSLMFFDAVTNFFPQQRSTVPPPHLIVVPPGRYLPNDRIFEVPEHTACDKLLPRGHMCCRSDEYHLGVSILGIYTLILLYNESSDRYTFVEAQYLGKLAGTSVSLNEGD